MSWQPIGATLVNLNNLNVSSTHRDTHTHHAQKTKIEGRKKKEKKKTNDDDDVDDELMYLLLPYYYHIK